MPDSEAATAPLVYPGETPGQAELEAYLEIARPKFLRGAVSFLVQGRTPPEWDQYAPQAAVPETDAERPGPPKPPATTGGQPGPNIVDFAALRKIQQENRGIAKANTANQAKLEMERFDAITKLAREIATSLEPKAKTLLGGLQKKHQLPDMPSGICDGVAMWKDIEAGKALAKARPDQARISQRIRELSDPSFFMPDNATEGDFLKLKREFEFDLQPFADLPLPPEQIVLMYVAWIPQGMQTERSSTRSWIEVNKKEKEPQEVAAQIAKHLGQAEVDRDRAARAFSAPLPAVGSAAAAQTVRPRQVSFAADVCVGCECECECEQWREQESLWRDVARNARANVTGMSIPSPFVFGGGSVVAEGGVKGCCPRYLPGYS